jgi:hypothetical protein
MDLKPRESFSENVLETKVILLSQNDLSILKRQAEEVGAPGYVSMVDNIRRDPFEIVGGLDDLKSAMSFSGAIASPSTAYLYDWNMLPLGQLLWLKELMSYKEFPPLRAPETYNLDGILAEMKAARSASRVGE